MNLLKNIKIDKSKITQLGYVLATLFVLTIILYRNFITGSQIFASSDYFAPKMISESIKNLQNIYGEYPYWLPSIFGGMPTVHSLQNISDYYFPNYVLNILKIFSTPEIWTQLLHLIFGGTGTYILLKFLKTNSWTALIGSISFLMIPYMNVCIVHGHGSQIMTASYFPWVCISLFRLRESITIKNLGLLAILIGFQLQRGHIQIAYYTWIMIGIFVLFSIISNKTQFKFYYYIFIALCSGFLMSISIIWPSYLYSEYSIRSISNGGAAFEYATNWSFSFSEMITFLVPSFYGFGGSTYWGTIEPAMTDFPNYLGLLTIIFVIYGLIMKNKNYYFLFFIINSLFFLLLSMGKNFFLFEDIFNLLPFFNKFRVPMMSLMMFQFSFVIISAIGLQHFIDNINYKKHIQSLVSIASFIGLTLLFIKFVTVNTINLDLSISYIVKQMIHDDLNRSLLIIILFISVIVYLLYSTIKKTHILGIILILTCIDMYFINNKVINYNNVVLNSKTIENVLKPLDTLKSTKVIGSIPSRSISFTGYNGIRNWMSYSNLQDITGYHPAKLKNYGLFEPYLNTNIGRNLFKMLNVENIINWNDEWEISSTLQNLEPLDRIFMIDNLINYNKDEELLIAMNSDDFDPRKISYTKSNIPFFSSPNLSSSVKILKWTPNHILIETNSNVPILVGLSEIYYPNWEITSHDIDIIEINGLLRSFVAPKGSHKIKMVFNYDDIYYSSIISKLIFLLMLFLTLSTKISTIFKRKNESI